MRHCTATVPCTVISGASWQRVLFASVVGAVARQEALHVLLGALLGAFLVVLLLFLKTARCFSERLGSDKSTKPHVPWVMPSSHVDCSTSGLAVEIYLLRSLLQVRVAQLLQQVLQQVLQQMVAVLDRPDSRDQGWKENLPGRMERCLPF